MKKTFSINLGGIVFNIDEDAYELLKNYLENLRAAFASESDANDIVNDIETRICEILLEETIQAKRVIELPMIENVISRIGNPDEINESITEMEEDSGKSDIKSPKPEHIVSSPTSPASQTCRQVKKKFFRDPKDKELGGVCSGIGHYIGLDSTWVRLIFVALCFASFNILTLIYIILWVVVPEAHTAQQRLEMLGEPQTLQNIGETVKDNFNNEPNTPPPFPRFQSARTESGGKGLISSFLSVLVSIFKIILIIIGIISIPVLVALALGIVGCIFSLALFGGAAIGWWGSNLLPNEPELFPALFCGIFSILTIGIPLLAIVYLIFKNTFKLSVVNKGWKIALLVIWLISLLGMVICINILA